MTSITRCIRSLSASLALLGVFSPASAAEIVLAEFRADQQAVSDFSAFVRPADRAGASVDSPVLAESLEIGSLWLDYRFGESLSVDQGPGISLGTTVGQRFEFLPGQSTDVYYGWNYFSASEFPYAPVGASQRRFRSGVGHTLDFLNRRLAVRFGYEFERGGLTAFAEDASAHNLGMTGLWRFDDPRYEASVGANYGMLTFPSYAGVAEQTGEQIRLHALLQRKFGDSLSGRLRYSFAEEEFDDPAFSLRRHSLGLDLQYRY
jgi:hypothetical protein